MSLQTVQQSRKIMLPHRSLLLMTLSSFVSQLVLPYMMIAGYCCHYFNYPYFASAWIHTLPTLYYSTHHCRYLEQSQQQRNNQYEQQYGINVHLPIHSFQNSVFQLSVSKDDDGSFDDGNSSSSSSASQQQHQQQQQEGEGEEEQQKQQQVQLPYASPILWNSVQEFIDFQNSLSPDDDPLWEQVKLEALSVLGHEPEAGPQIYQGILSQPSLLVALVTIVAHDIETELIKATALRNLFLEMLTKTNTNNNDDDDSIVDVLRNDVIAVATRSPSVGSALTAILFHMGLHAVVCYRVGHRLWQENRTGLAYYLQSTVSRRYSADIHPACRLGSGIYLSSTAGVVIGETAVTGNDVSILHGVTLGGTGKERGDRHPKVGHGVILQDGATVLGNIKVGDGSVITAKSIVTKPVPPLAIMRGVPAKVSGYRCLEPECFSDDLEMHLAFKYLDQWKQYLPKEEDSQINI